jgi:hypothetical protein
LKVECAGMGFKESPRLLLLFFPRFSNLCGFIFVGKLDLFVIINLYRKIIIMKDIINALQNSVKNIKNIPAAPIFDDSNIKAEFSKMGLPEKFVNSAIEELRIKHNEIHGNNVEKIARIILSEIIPVLGGIEEFSSLIRTIKSEEIENSKVKFTNKELENVDNKEAQAFIEKVKILYNNNNEQVSDIVEKLNFYSYSTLNNFIRDNKEIFPKRN